MVPHTTSEIAAHTSGKIRAINVLPLVSTLVKRLEFRP